MRSIHKKTLKRFLSTLLALTMVLGMVPFTALAAPADVTLTKSGLTATITPSDPDPAAVTAGSTSAVTYTVEIAATNNAADGETVKLNIGGTSYDFGTVTINSSSEITGATEPAHFNSYSITAGKITGKVTKYYDPGSHNIPMTLTVGGGTPTADTTNFTVDRKANLTVTTDVPSGGITAGENFTVTATSDIAEGYVQFEYNGSKQSVEVIPMLDGSGYAECTFTAVTSEVEVKATQFGMSGGVVNTEATKNIAVNPIPVYRTITYAGNAVDAYNVPAAGTVANGMNYTVTDAVPNRTGFTFVKWNTKADGSGDNYTSGATISGVGADITLYAVWTKNTVTVHYPASDPTGADVIPNGDVTVPEGSTVTFAVTPDEGYDPATLTVTAGGVALAPVAIGATGVYQYSFVANADTVIHVLDLSKLQYTVALPTGDNFNAVFTGTDDENKTSVVKKYDDAYSFKVDPVGNYTVKAVYVNGVEQTGASGAYGPFTVKGPQTISIVMEAIQFCTVTYVVDGAQLTTRQVQKGSPIPSDVKAPIKEGYTFDGWYTAPDFSGTENSLGTAATDCEVYGRYVAQTGTIAYDANDGAFSGSAPATTKTYGQAVTLTTTVPTREGHTFLGWAYEDTATTPVYGPGATYSTEITPPNGTVTLYAVWQKNTYTVTLPSGTGYTVSSDQSTTVEWDKNFTFTITVDRAYAATKPTVKVNGTDVSAEIIGQTETSKEATWSYTIKNIKEDKVVSITVVMNQTYTVTLAYDMTDDNATYEDETFRTLEVEHGYKVTQPEAPSVPGYEFVGWMDSTKAAVYDFSTLVTAPTTIYAQMKPIVPSVTWTNKADDGWNIDVTNATLVGETALNVSPNTVAYGSDMTFTITVDEGWDASKMQVAANGAALSAVEIDTTTSAPAVVYKYLLSNITADTTITVVGVVRKTVTITYNANARDDVSDMPEQQVVNYYLSGASGNSKIIKQIPVRTGYEFLGWCTDSAYTGTGAVPVGETYYAKTDIEAGADSVFTKDTTLYAIWEANATTIGLAVSDTVDDTAVNKQEYEGQKVTLTATIEAAPSTGSVIFYQSSDGTTWTVISSQSANGSDKYTFEATTGAYSGTDTYKVEYKAESAEGYSDSTSNLVSVDRLSTTITWKLTTSDAVEGTAAYYYSSTIKITEGTTALTPGTAMTAGQTYTLTAPAVYELGTDYTTALTVGTDYTITWQYLDGANGWKTLAENQTTSDYQVKSEYSQYQFRALMVVNTGVSTVYTKAAKFASEYYGARQTETMSWLISEPTPAVALQETTTTLAITGAVEEAANQVLFGATKFGWGNHLVQYENQTVTLKATVTDNATDLGVNSVGKVYFYRYTNDGVDNNDVLLNANGQGIEVGPDGIATMNYTMPDYDSTKAASDEENCSRIYAVYVEGVTYDTSASVSFTTDALGVKTYGKPSNGLKNMVFSKSTTIKTPVIDSARTGKLNGADATYTSYDHDLTELLAGVSHTFTLRTGNAVADWSVVALDGRTVDAENYDIQWLVTTGSNEEQAPNDATQASFVVNESKNGDKYRVKLIHKGDMTADAFSNYVVINSLQNVTVEVTASDEIDSTAATDVYQLNNITLTAEVQGKDSQIMLPTGNVTFYYSVNGTNWVEIGTAALKQDDVSRTMKATIVTDKLPVDVDNGYKQEQVTVTAVYAGDETFNKSGTATLGTNGKYEIVDTVNGDVTDATVTVYSSVVYVADNENKASGTVTDGINITANGSLVANETNVTLTLSDIYTLDHAINLSKLVYGTDYTVQWQKLDNAIQNQDKDTSGNVISGSYTTTNKWSDINGEINRSYTISSVVQDAAYRAEITVTNTAPVQGSAQGVLQNDADDMTTGRKVYYSNVLVVGAGQATVTTNITTSANTKFNEEGIVAGETVTIHALVAGASNVTPISNLTATILPQGVTDPALAVFTDEVTTVNGYNAFTWDTTGVTPGYYTLTVKATSNNGYAPQTITRTLIVRDNNYKLEATTESKVYNGKAQGIDWSLTGVDIENTLAQKSVVVYYYKDGKLVEPTQAGTYNYELYLPASAYWTELTHVTGEFTITPRPVNVVDLIAQAKVYDGTTDINELEVILNDSAIDANGVATGETGIINGDSIYATGVMAIDAAGAGTRTLSVSNVTLHGDDADNYVVDSTSYTETINVQRSQVKGDIADSTFQYTGSNITVPADDIYLIDQAGNVLTPADYTVTYYYHNGDGVEKVTAMNKLGKYTVIARPEQNNYKGGASQTVYVAATADDQAPVTIAKSALIDITNTVELFGAAGNTGIQASATNGATITKIEYYVSGSFAAVADISTLDAGRYLVKVTASTGDTAYGIYTIVKANPVLELRATGAEYTSAQISGTPTGTFNGAAFPTGTYFTYAGGTIQGIAYEAPTEAGDYVVTAHVGETDNFTAHEVSANFTIAKAPLKITADDLARWQYGSYPDMVATFEGLATGGVAADTSLRDVQIQPEFIFNDLNGDGQPEYTNSALDQVGKDYPITVRNALARNYTVTYVAGSYAVNELDPKADLAIHGMIDNGTTTENIAYYGDQIQLYAYGNYKSNGNGTGVYNPSSLLEWSLSAGAPATIDQDGLLTITGVGTFTVTLTRGSGDAAISTSIEIEAKKQEVKVIIPEENKVYSGAEQTYTTANGYAVNGKLANVSSDFNYSNTKRTDVGSQIVTGKVLASDLYYQSETYGGLFTINDKEVTVKPNEASVVYGETLGTLTYTEEGIVTGTPALTNGKAVSIRDSYVNLDVLDGYEILVAGVENKNYNVKYVTDQIAPDAEVTAKPLTFKTGVIDSDGRTSGYMEDNDQFYKDEGYAITGRTFNANPNDRMYGEINPVMDYLFTGLVGSDNEADLKDILDWLVEYSDGVKLNINGVANVKFDKTKHLGGHRATTAAEFISGAVNNYVIDGMLGTAGVKNYTTTVTEATQNIYQRPVTLTVRPDVTLTAYKPTIINSDNSVNTTVLLQLLLNNLVVGEYSTGKGGLATLLGHTIENLEIGFAATPTYNAATGEISVTIKLGNTNYWTENVNFTVKVDPSKIIANYGPLGWTSATVTMTGVDEHGNSTGLTNVSGNVQYLIFVKDTTVSEHKYSHYKNLTPVRSVTMTYGGSTGYYIANYDRLSAGDYVMFAIAEGYTIIE